MNNTTEITGVFIDNSSLLSAVRKLGDDFRTHSDSTYLQTDSIEHARIALLKIALQLKWWPLTRVKHVDHGAFGFLAERLHRDGCVLPKHICCAHEKQYVSELVRAGVIKRQRDGSYIESTEI